jgi:capsular polysaccharide biosynthesis protein
VTLFELLALLRKHLTIVVALPLATAAIVALGSIFLPNEYTATTTMYVLSKTADEAQTAITQSDLSAGQMLTNDVSTILSSARVKADVAEQFGMENLDGYHLSITSSTTTRVITLAVTGADPAQTAAVANALVETTSRISSEVMQIESVNVIDEAKVPTEPSGPRRALYTLVGFMTGLFAAVAIVVIYDMLDTRVRSGSDVEELVGVPVVGHFPALERS